MHDVIIAKTFDPSLESWIAALRPLYYSGRFLSFIFHCLVPRVRDLQRCAVQCYAMWVA